jgi:hypothetical protein
MTTGTSVFVTHQFNDIDGDPQTPSMVIGDQLPINSKLFTWNGMSWDTEDYLKGVKTNPDAWTPDNASIEPGIGFFLECSLEGTNESYDVFLLGEVPDVETNDVTAQIGLTALGYPYPAQEYWTNTAIALGAKTNDRFFTWNGATYDIEDYLKGVKTNPDAWTNPEKILQPGEGWFYDTGTGGPSRVATEMKPYTWP